MRPRDVIVHRLGEAGDGQDPADEQLQEAAWLARCVGQAQSVPLHPSDLNAIASHLVTRHVERGEVLFRAGNAPAGVWIVKEGRIQLVLRRGRRAEVVMVLSPGDVEGDIALVLGRPHAYDGEALEESECLFLGSASFTTLLQQHGSLGLRWLTSCAERIARSHSRILELLGASLRAQLARLLLDEAEDGKILVSQQTLAAMLGVQRASVNKTLKDFEQEGLVTLKRVAVTIADRQGLQRVAGQ